MMLMINKAEAKGIVCQKKGQDVNQCVFIKWTIRDQLQRLQSLEVAHQCNKQGLGFDLNATLNLDANEDPEGKPEDEEDFESDMMMSKVDNQKH